MFEMQISRPLTAVKQGMMLMVAFTIFYLSMMRLPELIAGYGNVRNEFIICGIVWVLYGLAMFIYTFVMPNRPDMRPSFLFMVCAVAFISFPLWAGIALTNIFFGEPDNI